jgi:hypothetical protein
MEKHEGYFYWGVLLGAAAAAFAGCVILARSFKESPASGGSPRVAPKGRTRPAPARAKTGAKRPARRPTAKK